MDTVPIFILGVESNYRGLDLEKSLKEFGLQFQNVWGPTISSLTPLQVERATSEYSKFVINRTLKLEEVACCLGHLSMYIKFAETGKDWALFLEDDTILISDPSPILEGLQVTNSPVHISIHDGPHLKMLYMSKSKGISIGFPFKKLLDPPYGAYAYLINRSAALKILDSKSDKFISSPDWPYIWPGTISYFQTRKVYFSHPVETEHSIIGERINSEQLWKNRIPSLNRFFTAIKLGVPYQTAYNRELKFKFMRICGQIAFRASSMLFSGR